MVANKVSQTSSQQGNDLFQVKSLSGQTGNGQSNSNLSAWIAENFKKTQKWTRRRFDSFNLGFSALREMDDTSLETLPDDLLKMFLNEFRVSAAVSAKEGAGLVEFRNQLTAFDQTITQYQAMPEAREDGNGLLNDAKSARESFLRKSVEALNKDSTKDLVKEDSYIACALDHVIGSGWRDGLDDGWIIDANAQDIYGEIDRVLARTRGVAQSFNSGISMVAAELESRGHSLSDPYADYFAHQKASTANCDSANRRASTFQELYNTIWVDVKERVGSASAESVSL